LKLIARVTQRRGSALLAIGAAGSLLLLAAGPATGANKE